MMLTYFLYIIVPMIISNTIHMLLVKKDVFPSLSIPIAVPLFGANKTWRGFVLLPLLNGLAMGLLNGLAPFFSLLQGFVFGVILGVVYLLFELPNSWLKRRLGIAAGASAEQHAFWFKCLDKTDSSFGVSLACFFLLDLSIWEALQLFLMASLTHVLFSWILVWLKIKKTF